MASILDYDRSGSLDANELLIEPGLDLPSGTIDGAQPAMRCATKSFLCPSRTSTQPDKTTAIRRPIYSPMPVNRLPMTRLCKTSSQAIRPPNGLRTFKSIEPYRHVTENDTHAIEHGISEIVNGDFSFTGDEFSPAPLLPEPWNVWLGDYLATNLVPGWSDHAGGGTGHIVADPQSPGNYVLQLNANGPLRTQQPLLHP